MTEREFNNVRINVEFSETANRQQINSGEEIKTLFGKIRKWFSDLKKIAFTGSYNDLSDVPQYVPAESGLYKITVDELGNVSTVVPVTKQDIINLGVETGYNFEVGSDGHLYVEPKT